jgi:hypothetical protein
MDTLTEQLKEEIRFLRNKVENLESKMDIVMGELLLLKQNSPQNEKRTYDQIVDKKQNGEIVVSKLVVISK